MNMNSVVENMKTEHGLFLRHRNSIWALLTVCILLFSGVADAEGDMDTGVNLPVVQQGFELPDGLEFIAARGTGRTTGQIANLAVRNNSDQPLELAPGMMFIPGRNGYKGYIGYVVPGHMVPAGSTQHIPVGGYCASVCIPPVPNGAPLSPPEDWWVYSGETAPGIIPAVADPAAPGLATIPGTDTPMPRAINLDKEPEVAAPLLLAAFERLDRKTIELQENGDLTTPFSANAARERQAVIQQAFWIFAAELENDPYTKEEFTSRLEAQYEASTNVTLADAPDEDRKRLVQGADDFWNSFSLVGVEARVFSVPEGARAGSRSQSPKEETQEGGDP